MRNAAGVWNMGLPFSIIFRDYEVVDLL